MWDTGTPGRCYKVSNGATSPLLSIFSQPIAQDVQRSTCLCRFPRCMTADVVCSFIARIMAHGVRSNRTGDVTFITRASQKERGSTVDVWLPYPCSSTREIKEITHSSVARVA